MPYIDSHLFDKKGVKKNLVLVLDEGDGILESVKAGMQEHGLEKARIDSVEGSIKEAVINYFEGGRFTASVIKNKELLNASGNFKINYGELFGQMKIITSEKPPVHGTLVRGKACDGLRITLCFLELVGDEGGEEACD